MMYRLYFIAPFLFSSSIFAQVGVGTTSPKATIDVVGTATDITKADGILAPRLTGNELSNKTAYDLSHDGTLVYITTADTTPSGQTINVNTPGYYYFDGVNNKWERLISKSSSKVFKFDLTSSETHPGTGWIYPPLNANDVTSWSDTSVYTFTGNDAQVEVLEAGTYQVSASVAFTNLPAQPVKYILQAITSSGSKYLTRGFVELPGTNFWGASGLNTFNLNANGTIRFRLFMANNTGNAPLGVNLNYTQLDMTIVKLN